MRMLVMPDERDKDVVESQAGEPLALINLSQPPHTPASVPQRPMAHYTHVTSLLAPLSL